MSAKVYVASLPTRYDAASGGQVPSLDLNPATAHGALEVLTTGPQATGDALDAAIDLCATRGEDYCHAAGDCILMVGDPILNAAFIASAFYASEAVRLLRWDRKAHKYNEVEMRL